MPFLENGGEQHNGEKPYEALQSHDPLFDLFGDNDSYTPESDDKYELGNDASCPAEIQPETGVETACGDLRRAHVDDQGYVNPSGMRNKCHDSEQEVIADTFGDIYEVPSSRDCSPGTNLEGSRQSKELSTTHLRTPLPTPPQRRCSVTPTKTTVPTAADEKSELILRQTLEEFVVSSLEEIEPLRFPSEVEDTFQSIFFLLKGPPRGETQYSSGSEWGALLRSGRSGRQRGSIYYTLSLMALARWHGEQAHPDIFAA
ncbi:hypothetical protein HD806DRAFT_535253 [Xylariaceae sp. AK1471]|nr:hypothetical protein HD806DRAFT_535253 [Xylariaceae sp. AK1471]